VLARHRRNGQSWRFARSVVLNAVGGLVPPLTGGRRRRGREERGAVRRMLMHENVGGRYELFQGGGIRDRSSDETSPRLRCSGRANDLGRLSGR